MSYVILSFGSNIDGTQGSPIENLSSVIKELSEKGVNFVAVSSLYFSPALGATYQPPFYNLVAVCTISWHPNKLLKNIKQLERAYGRRGMLVWGARPLDIDIIDYKGQILNWSSRRKQSKVSPLSLPHLQMHQRAFVLKPLAEILPKWRHPVLGLSVTSLMRLNCSPMVLKATKKLEIGLNV